MGNFDLMAENFDNEARVERAKAFARELRTHIVNGGNKKAIEFGCGTGLLGFELINDFDSITFIDSSSGMIKQTEQKLINAGISKSRAICCDLLETTPDNLYADYIFSSLALHHIVETESILTRLFNLLNKDGHLLIIDLNKEDGSFHSHHSDFEGHNGFEQSYLSGLCEKIGFRETEIKTFYQFCKKVNSNEKPHSLFILDAMK